MADYFEVEGRFTDDDPFTGIIKSTHDVDESEDDSIFFYGLEESDIMEAIRTKELVCQDFYIDNYRVMEV